MEVSRLAAVRRGCALLQLITVLLQLAKRLVLHNTRTHRSDTNRSADNAGAIQGYPQSSFINTHDDNVTVLLLERTEENKAQEVKFPLGLRISQEISTGQWQTFTTVSFS